MIYTDRSRQLTGQRCLRERFYRYHFPNGTRVPGLEKIGFSFAPETGKMVHLGLDYIILGREPDEAVQRALTEYAVIVNQQQIDLPPENLEQSEREKQEQFMLVEALIRCWAAVVWPRERQAYQTLEIEREEQADFPYDPYTVRLLARCDWLQQRRSDGSIFIKNFKTVSDPGRVWQEQWRYDTCTMSEVLAVEQRLEVQISGVIIQGLLKGRREEYPRGSGQRQHNSPLIRCWYRSGNPPMEPAEFYPLPRYEYECSAPHKMGNGRSCPGNRQHKLSSVHKELVAQVYPGGIKAWIDWLLQNDPEVLESQIVELPPILRNPYEIERWKRQTLTNEAKLHAFAEQIAQTSNEQQREHLMDGGFPMSAGENCVNDFGHNCAFLDLCWSAAGRDPLGCGAYRSRTANHPQEGVEA